MTVNLNSEDVKNHLKPLSSEQLVELAASVISFNSEAVLAQAIKVTTKQTFQESSFTKEKLMEIIIDDLRDNFDDYKYAYILYYPLYVSDDRFTYSEYDYVIDSVFSELGLTNSIAELEKNREQVRELMTNKELMDSVCDVLENDLGLPSFDESSPDVDIIEAFFKEVMINMLYVNELPSTGDMIYNHVFK